MPAYLLGSTYCWMMSGVGCHHRLWTTYMVERDCACYAIIAIGKHTRSDDVVRDMQSFPLDSTHCGTTSACCAIIAVEQHIRLENVRRSMPSWPLSRKHFMAYHYRPRRTYTVRRCWAWIFIIDLGLHTRSDDIGNDNAII
ncbi:hypothetical protein EJD97_003934, partial [Solanum chilense]